MFLIVSTMWLLLVCYNFTIEIDSAPLVDPIFSVKLNYILVTNNILHKNYNTFNYVR